jgi:hypothetical protein
MVFHNLYFSPKDATSLSQDLMTLVGLSVQHLMRLDTTVDHPRHHHFTDLMNFQEMWGRFEK